MENAYGPFKEKKHIFKKERKEMRLLRKLTSFNTRYDESTNREKAAFLVWTRSPYKIWKPTWNNYTLLCMDIEHAADLPLFSIMRKNAFSQGSK